MGCGHPFYGCAVAMAWVSAEIKDVPEADALIICRDYLENMPYNLLISQIWHFSGFTEHEKYLAKCVVGLSAHSADFCSPLHFYYFLRINP